MKTLTYYVSENLDDSQCYNLRGQLRRDVVELLREYGLGPKGGQSPDGFGAYGPVHKVTVEYCDPFDLVWQAMSEGRIYEGSADLFSQALAWGNK